MAPLTPCFQIIKDQTLHHGRIVRRRFGIQLLPDLLSRGDMKFSV